MSAATYVLSRRLAALAPSATQAMDSRVKELTSAGIDVANLTLGEPDFDAIEDAKDGVIAAVRSGFNKYTPAAGMPELRRAIATKLRDENGAAYAPDEIVVCTGAKQALANAFSVLLDPGDEVVLQAPYWVSYPEMVKLAEGVPVIIETNAGTGFKLTPEMVRTRLTSRTRMLVLNSPANPTGVVYTPDELRALAELAIDHELMVLSDEIYETLVYDQARFACVASFTRAIRERTITVNGFSKVYAMTGWRLGYAAAPRPIAQAMAVLQGHTTSGACSLTQRAALAVLARKQPAAEAMRREFDRRRRYLLAELATVAGIEVEVIPEGAFYVFARVSGLFGSWVAGRPITCSDELALALLEHARVAVVSGTGFGAPDHVRISYATSLERLEQAVNRLRAFVATIGR